MNNNNRNNNRRRGRGSNNRQGGGGQQTNRIDSRARGNAPQMLEKYRKLALDSHMNGDRVNEEYYLQFADHYFRVIADTRVRQEEQRTRRDERWQDGNESGSERDFDYTEDATDPYDDMRQGGGDSRQGGERQNGDRFGRADAQDRPERQDRAERQDRPERYDRQDRSDRDRGDRLERQDAEPRIEQAVVARTDPEGSFDEAPASAQDAEPRSVYEPAENPFVRGDREGRGLKQRRQRRPAANEQAVDQDPATGIAADDAASGPSALDVFDPAILPPAVALRLTESEEAFAESASAEAEETPKPRRRTRRPRAVDGSDEALQAVS